MDTNQVIDWVRADDNGNGLEGVAGAGGALCTDCAMEAVVAGSALITPGASNAVPSR
jgi:hypothetical protein